MSQTPAVAVIGGSGLYHIEGLENTRWHKVETPFGSPSDEILEGTLQGQRVLFLPRHARGHRLNPGEVPYRANIYALKSLGAKRIVSVSAVGSLQEHLQPGLFVIVDQFVDFAFARDREGQPKTFFREGVAGHVSMAYPVCSYLTGALEESCGACGIDHQMGGTYFNMEGPQFSTKAESKMYRAWGMDIIGMTNAAEAKLAREAGMCYATVALVTDFDCWHPDHDAVTVDQVVAIMQANVAKSRQLLAHVLPLLDLDSPCHCQDASAFAVITDPTHIGDEIKGKLASIWSPRS
ncbi:MAG: S-methyl-5'-thioadenosine phosphorylase [Alphaproteobacteria bacterium CG_4_10_14_0_2_um_filter_63_37]|nr:MAG: methylthioadenosine phosphorylase [Proteobacteria bacterium CG1_02_64_396]PJA25248.1 MAG: S-methyl-5'-thioadenosine phosphorylase [Alphaproteobacteria bacterium CG_4_10_14_0_2_um_filter_63_37]